MLRRTHTESPDRVAQNDANRVPFGLSVAARGFFASRGVEARPRGPEPARDPLARPRPSTPALRAYAQGERVKGVGAGDSQEVKALERRCGKKQCGIATVEFAIAVPVLLLLLCAAAEVGKWLYEYNTLHKAVRDGVRYLSGVAIRGTTGVIDPAITTDPQNEEVKRTKCLVVYGISALTNGSCTGTDPVLPGLTTGKVTVTVIDAAHVQVQVGAIAATRYDYQPIFDGIPTFGFGNGSIDFNIDMTASATMRAL